jgi:hypothetical protein
VSQSPRFNSAGNLAAAATRRSTRIERSVPLIVLGQDQLGQPFMERTASLAVNKHGCRYPSRHDYGVGTSVTLQLVGSIVDCEKPRTVRAVVRSVHPPASLRELQQVGVELETPGNVWGIVPAPADWTSAVETNVSTPKLTGEIADATGSETKKVRPREALRTPEPKMAEVASITPPEAPRPLAPQSAEAPQVKRVVVTPDGLISALQGKLQQEAERAVQAALAKQVNDGIQDALRSIDDARQLSVREVRDLVPKQIEEMKLSLKEGSAAELAAQRKAAIEAYRARADEMAQGLKEQACELRRELASAAQECVEKMTREIEPLIPARLTEVVRQATSDFESATAVVVNRRYEQLLGNVQIAAQEALLNLNARSAELQALSQNVVTSGLEELRRETERHVKIALADTQERSVSALSSLDAESNAICDARRQSLDAEVSRLAERATDEFRKGMQAFLHSCLAAATGAVDKHARTTLNGLSKGSGEIREEPSENSAKGDESEIIPDTGSGLLTH